MSQRRSTGAFPVFRHSTPSADSIETRRTVDVYKKKAFCLDGCLRQAPARAAASNTVVSHPTTDEDKSSLLREAQSPAEALLATTTTNFSGVASATSLQPNLNGELWRSQLLQCETELRELVVIGVDEPPSLKRTLKTMDLFDRFSDVLQGQPNCCFISDILRLFRVELCRAIFITGKDAGDLDSGNTALLSTGKSASAVSSTPGSQCRTYFDEAESLRRAKAFLEASYGNGSSSESALLLQRRIEDKDEQITWYESELECVRRQHEQVCEEYRRLREKSEKELQEALSTQRQLQREVQNLRLENKDVQLQLFRVRKQVGGGNLNQVQEGYRNLKLSKVLQTQSLFDEGDERVALLVFLGQVESRVNEVLDAYDNDFALTPESAQNRLKTKMADKVVVLLEDMHFCESAYRRLVHENRKSRKVGVAEATADESSSTGMKKIPLELVHTGDSKEAPDETDGFVAILFDQRVYDHFNKRHVAVKRLEMYEAERSERSKHTGAKKSKNSNKGDSLVAGSPVMSEKIRSGITFTTTESGDSNPFPNPTSTVDAQGGDALSKSHAPLQSSAGLQSDAPGLQIHNSTPTLTESVGAKRVSLLDRKGQSARAQWVSNILGASTTSVAFTIPRPYSDQAGVCVVERTNPDILTSEVVMKRVFRHPMQDLLSNRFLSSIELFTGEDPIQQKLLCRVNRIDPSLPIQVPEATNFVKIKYAHAEKASGVAAAAPKEGSSTAYQTASTSGSGECEADGDSSVFAGNSELRIFKGFANKGLVDKNPALQYRAGAVNSTTASTVAFQRLQPLSPERAPEWLLYQQLFGGYRSLTPRMIEVSTIDHLMACASERFFIRMEYRFDDCLTRATQQCTSLQLQQDTAMRFFKDMYVLSDFQEALIDELESRYGYPELVAKTLYEILCYLDAVSEKDPVLASYLDVIRGFSSPTQVHYISYMLYHLSYCWPSSDPTAAVNAEEVLMVFEYIYRNATTLVLVDPGNVLREYEMATRSAPLTFVSVRNFFASAMSHMEELLLIFLQSRFHMYTEAESIDQVTWDVYEEVLTKCGRIKEEQRSLVRFAASGLGVNRPTVSALQQLSFLGASAWCSNLWE